MNGAQNRQNNQKRFTIPRNLLWGGAIIAIAIAFVLFLGIFMSSSETPTAFLVKWKSALESGDPKRYEALWVKNARQRPDTGYQRTVRLLRDDVNFEVDLGGASQPYRVPRYTNRFRIEGIPLTVHYPGEAQQQLRNLVIEKKGIIQQRWKIVQEEIVGSELVPTASSPGPMPQTEVTKPPDSPVAPARDGLEDRLRGSEFKGVYWLMGQIRPQKPLFKFCACKGHDVTNPYRRSR